MTIPSAVSRNDYLGNGSADTFDYDFRILAAGDLLVTQADDDGDEETLVHITDYSVTGVGSANGGAITLVSGALPSGYRLSIRRVVAIVQETDLRNQGLFFAQTHEDQFDRGIMIAQQHQDLIARSVKLRETDPATDFDPTLPRPSPDTFFAWDSSGTALRQVPLSDIGVASPDPRRNDFRLSASNSPDPSEVASTSTVYLVSKDGPDITSGAGIVSLYDSGGWNTVAAAGASLSLTGMTSGKNYDVYAYSNAGTLTLELGSAWTNDATRATAIAYTSGVAHKSGDATRRYVGTIRATGATTTQDGAGKYFVWSFANRRRRAVFEMLPGGYANHATVAALDISVETLCGLGNHAIEITSTIGVAAIATTAPTANGWDAGLEVDDASGSGGSIVPASRVETRGLAGGVHGNTSQYAYHQMRAVLAGMHRVGYGKFKLSLPSPTTAAATLTFGSAGTTQGVVGAWEC